MYLVGSHDSGKSSVQNRYIHDTFMCAFDPSIEDSFRKQIEILGKKVAIDVIEIQKRETL